MIDGSKLVLDKNIALTKEVVISAKKYGKGKFQSGE